MKLVSNQQRRMSLRLWLLSGLALGSSVLWLLLGSLGCISEEAIFLDTWSFVLKLDPAKFQIAPNQTYSSTAQLLWSDEQRPLKSDWSIDAYDDRILVSAHCSPATAALSSTVEVQTADREALYGRKGIWTTGDSLSTRLRVLARFVDPVWASIAEQNVKRTRSASMVFEFSEPQLKAQMISIIPTYESGLLRGLKYKGRAWVEAAPPGWAYSFAVKNLAKDNAAYPDMVVTPAGDGRSIVFQRTKSPTGGTDDMIHWLEVIQIRATPTVAGHGFFLDKEIMFEVLTHKGG